MVNSRAMKEIPAEEYSTEKQKTCITGRVSEGTAVDSVARIRGEPPDRL